MKVLSIVLLLIVLITAGCKTQKIAPKPAPVKSETVVKPTTAVNSKEERITAAKGEANDLGSKKFYIILGSFGIYENAQNFKKQLMAEDFFPGILFAPDAENGKGMYRVSVSSFDDEATARAKVGEIRQKFAKYSDLWLLIKK
jgi:cell division protein FtsN